MKTLRKHKSLRKNIKMTGADMFLMLFVGAVLVILAQGGLLD